MRDKIDPDKEMASAYLNKMFGLEDSVLLSIREASQHAGLEGMQLSAFEGQLVGNLVRWTKSRTVLELGTLFGYSTLCLARGLPQNGRLYSVEKNPERYERARQFLSQDAEAFSKMTLWVGDWEEQLSLQAPIENLDFMFVDANKGAYLRALLWAEKHLSKNGFFVADNAFLFGAVYGKSIDSKWSESVKNDFREMHQRLSDPAQYATSLIPTSEGLLVAQKLF